MEIIRLKNCFTRLVTLQWMFNYSVEVAGIKVKFRLIVYYYLKMLMPKVNETEVKPMLFIHVQFFIFYSWLMGCPNVEIQVKCGSVLDLGVRPRSMFFQEIYLYRKTNTTPYWLLSHISLQLVRFPFHYSMIPWNDSNYWRKRRQRANKTNLLLEFDV